MAGTNGLVALGRHMNIAALPIFALGMGLGMPAIEWWQALAWRPYQVGAGVGLGLALVGTWLAVRVRPRPRLLRSRKQVLGLAVLLALGLGTGLTGGLLAVNAAADAAPPQTREVIVTDKSSSSSRGWRSHEVTVRSWQPQRDTVDIDVSAAVYERARRGQPIEVTTARGLLGWPYLVDIATGAGDA